MSDPARPSPAGRIARVVVSIIVCAVLLGGAAGASYLIFKSEPTAQREGATRRSAALVETITVQRGTYRPSSAVAMPRTSSTAHQPSTMTFR